jgi:hypothetical protein
VQSTQHHPGPNHISVCTLVCLLLLLLLLLLFQVGAAFATAAPESSSRPQRSKLAAPTAAALVMEGPYSLEIDLDWLGSWLLLLWGSKWESAPAATAAAAVAAVAAPTAAAPVIGNIVCGPASRV